jgi:hypothetical protein
MNGTTQSSRFKSPVSSRRGSDQGVQTSKVDRDRTRTLRRERDSSVEAAAGQGTSTDSDDTTWYVWADLSWDPR